MPATPHFTTLVRDFDPAEIADLYTRNAPAEMYAFPVPDLDTLAALRRDEHARVIIAEYSKTIIGVALLTFPARPEEVAVVPWFGREDLAVFSRLAVEVELRSMGVASAIIGCAERTAARMGAAQLGCACLGSSADFMGALERRGFTAAARANHHGERLVAMRKPIAAATAEAA